MTGDPDRHKTLAELSESELLLRLSLEGWVRINCDGSVPMGAFAAERRVREDPLKSRNTPQLEALAL